MTDHPCIEMSSKLCRPLSQRTPSGLLNLLEEKQLSDFEQALESCDPNSYLDDPHFLSLLDVACTKDKTGSFVRVLLNAKADPNKKNEIRCQTPIHFAANATNIEALQALLDDGRTDVNSLDRVGNTALHLLAKQKASQAVQQCIKLLLKSNIEINKRNQQEKTAILLAANNGEKETIEILLEDSKIDLECTDPINGKTARSIIMNKFPDLHLPEKRMSEENDNDVCQLFTYLYVRKCQQFITKLPLFLTDENKNVLNSNNGRVTMLQYAANDGFTEVVRELLLKGANPNATGPYEKRLPSILAASKGYYKIIEILIENQADFMSPSDGQTALHVLIEKADDRTSELVDYRKCFDLILDNVVKTGTKDNQLDNKIDINATDWKRNTALHVAASTGNKYFIKRLMECGAYIGILNCHREPPLANISSEIFENFLNERLSTNGKSRRDDNYEIKFDYKFLAPPVNSIKCTLEGSISLPLEDNNYSNELVPEIQPLLYISRTSDLRRLLKHPIFTSFLELKWGGIRPFFYVNLAFYLLFVALMTVYILFVYENYPQIHNSTQMNDTGSHNKTEHEEVIPEEPNQLHNILWITLVVLFVSLVLREVSQMLQLKHYLSSPENYLEALLIISSGLVLFCSSGADIRPHLSAVTILLSWAELVLLIGRHPRLSTNIEMLKRVSMNFLQFLAWYSILIIAFALSFYSLFRSSKEDDNFFLSPGSSFFKTVVMVTGEFDAGELPFVLFPGTSHVIFVLFVFLVAIVLFNLLNGLAVSDTQAIKDDAELVAIVSRVKLISYIESVLLDHPVWCRRRRSYNECCCCSLITRINQISMRRLPLCFQKINAFSSMIPNKIIRVFPNDCGRISTESEEEGKSSLTEIDLCHKNIHCFQVNELDPRILKEAIHIIDMRGHFSETEELRDLLLGTQKRMQCSKQDFEKYSLMIENLTHRVESIERNSEEILNILRQNVIGPFSPKIET